MPVKHTSIHEADPGADFTSVTSAAPRDFKASTIIVGGMLTKLCL
jgi:hypothetical protein